MKLSFSKQVLLCYVMKVLERLNAFMYQMVWGSRPWKTNANPIDIIKRGCSMNTKLHDTYVPLYVGLEKKTFVTCWLYISMYSRTLDSLI